MEGEAKAEMTSSERHLLDALRGLATLGILGVHWIDNALGSFARVAVDPEAQAGLTRLGAQKNIFILRAAGRDPPPTLAKIRPG